MSLDVVGDEWARRSHLQSGRARACQGTVREGGADPLPLDCVVDLSVGEDEQARILFVSGEPDDLTGLVDGLIPALLRVLSHRDLRIFVHAT